MNRRSFRHGIFLDSPLQMPTLTQAQSNFMHVHEQQPTFEIFYLREAGGRASPALAGALEVPKALQYNFGKRLHLGQRL